MHDFRQENTEIKTTDIRRNIEYTVDNKIVGLVTGIQM